MHREDWYSDHSSGHHSAIFEAYGNQTREDLYEAIKATFINDEWAFEIDIVITYGGNVIESTDWNFSTLDGDTSLIDRAKADAQAVLDERKRKEEASRVAIEKRNEELRAKALEESERADLARLKAKYERTE